LLSVAAVCAIAMIALAAAMGVGRFAFTPLLPLMVRDGLLAPTAGEWLAGSNYLGYLLGALTASRIGISAQSLLRASLLGIAVLTAAMGATHEMPAWMALRFAAGVLSAWALVSTSTWALGRLASAQRPDLAGIAFAGVGVGIALVGMFCVVAAGVHSETLWLQLGALAAVAVAAPVLLIDRLPLMSGRNAGSKPGKTASAGSTSLVVCYGAFGFGYILPATFLPLLAREVIDDPHLFGLAWPVFGIAAAAATIVVARYLAHMNRLRVWATGHLAMAVGVVIPTIWLSPIAIAIAALLVGSTFMVVTMIGMQEAQARSPRNPTALLGKMTAAFATGQLAGPLVSAILGTFPAGHAAGRHLALQAAAFVLASSAAYLFCLARGHPTEGASP
jgi:MFS family permease